MLNTSAELLNISSDEAGAEPSPLEMYLSPSSINPQKYTSENSDSKLSKKVSQEQEDVKVEFYGILGKLIHAILTNTFTQELDCML